MKIIEHQLNIPPDYQYNALRKGNLIQRQWHKNRLLLVNHLLRFSKKDTVCDLGAGSGNVVFSFHNKVKQLDATDYNKQCLDFIRSKIKNSKIKNVGAYLWDMLEPPPKQLLNRYDKAVFNEVIEHFDQDHVSLVLKNIRKVLKKNGEILITTPNAGISPWFLLEFVIDKFHLFPKLWGEQHKVRFNRKSLKQVCEATGFRTLKIGTLGLFSPLAILLSKRAANWIAKIEIMFLENFGPQLFIHLKKK